MNEFLSNLSHLTSVVGTIFMVGAWLIILARTIYPKLYAIKYMVHLAQGLTYALVVTTVIMAVAALM